MFKESTQKLIEYIQTFPKQERQIIADQILESKTKKGGNKKSLTKQKVLNDIKNGMLEIKEAKKSGKKLKSLDTFLNEI